MVGAITLIWLFIKFYMPPRENPFSYKRIICHIIIAFLIAVPSGIILGNLKYISNREKLTLELSNFQNIILQKSYSTRESWLDGKWKPSQGEFGPWALLIEEKEMSNLIGKYKDIHSQLEKYFTPKVVHFSSGVLYLLSSPHVATFHIKENIGTKGGIIAEHSFSNKQVRLLKELLVQTREHMEQEARLFFIPVNIDGSLSQYNSKVFPTDKNNDVAFLIGMATIANAERMKYLDKYFPNVVQGISLFLIGEETSAVHFLEKAIKLASSNEKNFLKEDYYLIACLLMDKHHRYKNPVHGDQDLKKADEYLALGEAANKERFAILHSLFEKNDYYDPDFKWFNKLE
jgi:hypothetical protein